MTFEVMIVLSDGYLQWVHIVMAIALSLQSCNHDLALGHQPTITRLQHPGITCNLYCQLSTSKDNGQKVIKHMSLGSCDCVGSALWWQLGLPELLLEVDVVTLHHAYDHLALEFLVPITIGKGELLIIIHSLNLPS